MAISRASSIAAPVVVARPSLGGSPGLWSTAAQRLKRDRLTLAAGGVLLAVTLLALAADAISENFFHYGFTRQNLLDSYRPPTLLDPPFWLGSDELGRSQVVRLLYGARVSLAVGFGAATINLTIGLALGLAAGYWRGWFDDLVQFAVSTLNSIPTLFLLLIVAVLFRPGPATLVILLGLLSWQGITLFVRGQTLSLREREFITAGRVLGASGTRVMLRHLLPNVLPLVIILSAIDVGGLILTESALSYLGLGISPPMPSWGNMLTNAASDLSRGPWLVYGPGVAIFVTVLCLYLLGDGLRDALDPRLRTTS
jgi:ABC-type dipeptide/oligopeptide/nickel transport system permease subunit